jgi:hypothetical protein
MDLKDAIPCQWALWIYPADFRPPEAFTVPEPLDDGRGSTGAG